MLLRCVGEDGGKKGGRSETVNEFKTNDMQVDVYVALHFAILYNGSKTAG